jgi:hypothetical protein
MLRLSFREIAQNFYFNFCHMGDIYGIAKFFSDFLCISIALLNNTYIYY